MVPAGGGQLMWCLHAVVNWCGVVLAGDGQLMWYLQAVVKWYGIFRWWSINVVTAVSGQLMCYLQVVVNWCGTCRRRSIAVMSACGCQLMWYLHVLVNWCVICRWCSIDVVSAGGGQCEANSERSQNTCWDSTETKNISSPIGSRVHEIFKYNNIYAWSVRLASFFRHIASLFLVDSMSGLCSVTANGISSWAIITAGWHLRRKLT